MADTSAFQAAERVIWRAEGVDPEERFVTLASGARVRVQEWGVGPPVLFVHGAMNGGASWANQIGRLPGVRCLALDRPGCGLSEPAPGRLDELDALKASVDDLIAEVLDALEIERASVVATSFGGLFAFRGAAAHPDRIERILEHSWSMGAPMDKVPLSLRMSAMPGMRQLMTRVPITRGAIRMMLRQIGLKRALANGRFSDDMIDWFHRLLRDTDTMRNEIRSTPDVFTPIAGLNHDVLLTDDELSRVTMPVQFVWGAEDPNGGAAVARAFSGRFADASLVVLDQAGHAPWIDEPERCAEITRDFLSGRPTAG